MTIRRRHRTKIGPIHVTDALARPTSCVGQLDALERTAALDDHVALAAELRTLCAEWRHLLLSDAPVAQPLLRQLLPERLPVTRTPDGVRITGTAIFGPMVARVLRGGMVAREGSPAFAMRGIVYRRAA